MACRVVTILLLALCSSLIQARHLQVLTEAHDKVSNGPSVDSDFSLLQLLMPEPPAESPSEDVEPDEPIGADDDGPKEFILSELLKSGPPAASPSAEEFIVSELLESGPPAASPSDDLGTEEFIVSELLEFGPPAASPSDGAWTDDTNAGLNVDLGRIADAPWPLPGRLNPIAYLVQEA